MQQSPLIQTEPLISSKGPGQKSPFKSYGDQMVRCNQIEQELYRVNQQRKLLAIELDELSNQFVKKSQKLQEMECLLEDYREKAIYAQKQEENARNQLKYIFKLIRQRTQEMYMQTKRLNYLEQKIQDSSRLMQDLQKQNQELRMTIKHQQESIRELNQDRQKLQSQLLYSQMEQEMIQFKDQKIKHLEQEKDIVTNELLKFKKDSNFGFDKQYDAKSEQIKQLQLEIQNFIKNQQLNLQQIEQQTQDIQLISNKKEKWKQRTKQLQKELEDRISKQQSERQSQESENQPNQQDMQDILDLQDKYSQLEAENEYLREQHIQQNSKIQELTDKLLKQQLQSSYTKEQQTFSFQEQQKQVYYEDDYDEQS